MRFWIKVMLRNYRDMLISSSKRYETKMNFTNNYSVAIFLQSFSF
uniref:Uncharacterized protein n=1 Tax=Populus trichocarpa x Populus deltoides TaxID=3695 RepID=A9PJP2_9ROSI|nr:unknown [Populus trichocarpa x Populus deltoides]